MTWGEKGEFEGEYFAPLIFAWTMAAKPMYTWVHLQKFGFRTVGPKAFHSGWKTAAEASRKGYVTLGETAEGKALAQVTASMKYEPGSLAYNLWAELSRAYAKAVPDGSVVHVFLNKPKDTGIWLKIEKPILEKKNCIIIEHYME